MSSPKKHYLSTKNLVTIAILASLGGALSTYIGYLGNLINRMIGVPFGAGQFMAGLHVIWILIAIGITRKKGAGTLTGVLKGTIELFLGSTHGIIIVLVSSIQGVIADGVLLSDKTKERRGLVSFAIAGGLSSASNVFIFQAFYFSGVPWIFIAMLGMLAAGSGIIFGGWITLQILESLEFAGVIEPRRPHPAPQPSPLTPQHIKSPSMDKKTQKLIRKPKPLKLASMVVTIAFLAAFTFGAVYYFTFVFVPPGTEGIEVTGEVEDEFIFSYNDFKTDEVTISAELKGSVTYVPEQNYTGVPLQVILDKAEAKADAKDVHVIARDGYTMEFDLDDVMSDPELIIIKEDESFRLVAANYDGSFWVKNVCKLEVK